MCSYRKHKLVEYEEGQSGIVCWVANRKVAVGRGDSWRLLEVSFWDKEAS